MILFGHAFAATPAMFINPADYNDITEGILSSAIEVHRTLGPGLLESTYMPCLQFELTARKLRWVTQSSGGLRRR